MRACAAKKCLARAKTLYRSAFNRKRRSGICSFTCLARSYVVWTRLPSPPLFVAAKELQAIVEAQARARARGERAALATVVKTSGSTYRRAGARMWIGTNSETVGSISGGCLEDDARDRAQEVIASGQPVMIHYDTTADGDILWGSGVGCQGVVHVLVEPLSARAADPLGYPPHESASRAACTLDYLATGLRQRRKAVLASVFRVAATECAHPGDFLWLAEQPAGGTPSSVPASSITNPVVAKIVHKAAAQTLRQDTSRVQTCPLPDGGEAEIFFDLVRPAQSLLILGAGHDAVPLARLAGELGWRVRVADRRRAYALHERFPGAAEVLQCHAHEIGTPKLPIEADEAVVVMTHNYLQDLSILRALLPSSAGYIGLLGPARRKKLLLGELARAPFGTAADENATAPEASSTLATPMWMQPASLRRIHGPAGLDIGAEAPEQIALSILAEIEAYVARRRGGSLKHRRKPLHQAIPKSAAGESGFSPAPSPVRERETLSAA